jgi:hypothetical protein
MKIGVCKQCISTNLPIHLTGFGNPNRKFTGVHDDIYATALVAEQHGKQIAIVTADVLGFDHKRLQYVRALIAERTNLSADAILFNASHTHSAPQVLIDCNPGIGAYEAEYAEQFYKTLVDIVCKAAADLEEGTLFRAETECYGIGVNRRRIIDGVYQFAAFEEGLRNDEVSVLKAVCGDKVKAVLFQCTCHPSTTGFDEISADYPGVARNAVEKQYPGATAMFLQGCCGNIRIRTIQENGVRFRAGTYEDVQFFGSKLADAVLSVLKGDMAPFSGELGYKVENFAVPLQAKITLEEYQNKLKGELSYHGRLAVEYFAGFYDLLPTQLPYSIQRIDLDSTLSIFALEGEVCVEYDYHMKNLLPDRHVITAGYSNGLPGYICTADMYPYGGYEPTDSALCYLLPNGFDPAIEQVILEHANRLV